MFERLGRQSLRRKLLESALRAALAMFHALSGAAVGIWLAELSGYGAKLRPTAVLLTGVVCGVLTPWLASSLRTELAKVVTPVHLKVEWWMWRAFFGWAVAAGCLSFAIQIDWAGLVVRWWLVALMLVALLATQTITMERRMARWWRGETRMADAPDLLCRQAQVVATDIGYLAMAVAMAVWAVQGLGPLALIQLVFPTIVMVACAPMLGPFDGARFVSRSPFPVLGDSWLMFGVGLLVPSCLLVALIASLSGAFSLSAASRFAVALLLALIALGSTYVTVMVVQRFRSVELIVDAIASGDDLARGRFALYLRSFTYDGQMGFDPWVGESKAKPAPRDTFHLPLDVESAISCALLPIGIPVVGLGHGFSQHIGLLECDEAWFETFATVSERALLVIGVLGPTSSVLDEVDHLMQHGLVKKMVFVMPPFRTRPELEEQWRRVRELAAQRGLELPPSHPEGALFTITDRGRANVVFPLVDTSVHGIRRAFSELLRALQLEGPAVGMLHYVVEMTSRERYRGSIPSLPRSSLVPRRGSEAGVQVEKLVERDVDSPR